MLLVLQKYRNIGSDTLSDIEIERLTDFYGNEEEKQLSSSDESIKSDEFVQEDCASSSPDGLDDLDMNMAQLELQSCIQKRKDEWALKGFADETELGRSNLYVPDSSWLFKRLIPDNSLMSSFHKSSTSTVTEKKEMSTTKQNQTVNQTVELTKTVTTIVQQVMVSHASSTTHLATSALALTNSPLSDEVFITPTTTQRIARPQAKVVDQHFSDSHNVRPTEVYFKMPKKYNATTDHPSYRKTPFKMPPVKSCLKNTPAPPKDENRAKNASKAIPKVATTKSNSSDSTTRSPKAKSSTAKQYCRKPRISHPSSSSSSDEEDPIATNWTKITPKQSIPTKKPHQLNMDIIDLTMELEDVNIKSEPESTFIVHSANVDRTQQSKSSHHTSTAKVPATSKPQFSLSEAKRTSKENKKPKNLRLDRKPKEPEWDPKSSAFNPRVALKRIDIEAYLQAAPSINNAKLNRKKVRNRNVHICIYMNTINYHTFFACHLSLFITDKNKKNILKFLIKK